MPDYSKEVKNLEALGLFRTTRPISSSHGAVVHIGGRPMINFASNNYLGLADHPGVKKAAIAAIRDLGWGSGASRLMSGTHRLHEELEERIAAFKGAEASLLFNSGYAANTGALPAILGPDWRVASDELNHASLIDGLRLSRADVKVYGHASPEEVEEALSGSVSSPSTHRAIVTDTVFSMDGDLAPLDFLDDISRRHDALLFLDDAHGTGLLGSQGRGAVSLFGIDGDHIVHMGTLSKAFGGIGGFVAGGRDLIGFLRSRARSYIYTTSLPPAACAASLAAFDLLEKDGAILREHLFGLCHILAEALKSLGQKADSTTPIFPVRTGDVKNTIRVSEALLEKGIFAPAIRPPTVAENACRLRISITAGHDSTQIDALIAALREVL